MKIMMASFAQDYGFAPACQHHLLQHSLSFQILQFVYMMNFIAFAIRASAELTLLSQQSALKRAMGFYGLWNSVRNCIIEKLRCYAILVFGKMHAFSPCSGFIRHTPAAFSVLVLLSYFSY